MPGVYLEYIKAGRYVVPVELTFQTETINTQGDIRGIVRTSKWLERHNWKEIKAMLKPAVEACLKYNDTPLENIPKSHHISYGREVSLGYLVVPNKVSTPFLHILDSKKNCWTDDEDDEDELLGIREPAQLKDHGPEFMEYIPTKTAIRVCVVKKSVVSIDDARRIRKELGVRSDDVRHYFSSAAAGLSNDPGPSSANIENIQPDDPVSEPPTPNERESVRSDPSSDSEAENVPRTFGDPDEIRDAARIYPFVLNRDADSGEDPDDDLSLPDIEPFPPKRKKAPRNRKKSTSQSPSKKRLTHNNILAIGQDGQSAFSEEDTGKRGAKKAKRKRTVAVVEPMRTLPNGQMSFEHAIGALSSDKRRKARPNSFHGADKTHGTGRFKQTPAIDIIAPDDDRLTIAPPEPIPVIVAHTSTTSPTKEVDTEKEDHEKKKRKKKKRRPVNIDDDPHKYERLTPSPLFDIDDDQFQPIMEDAYGYNISSSERESDHTPGEDSEPEMPTLTKMVDSEEENNRDGDLVPVQQLPTASSEQVATTKEVTNPIARQSHQEASPVLTLSRQQNVLLNPEIIRSKFNEIAQRSIKTAAERKKFPETMSKITSGKTSTHENEIRNEPQAPRPKSISTATTTPDRVLSKSVSELTNQFVQAFQNARNNLTLRQKMKSPQPRMRSPVSTVKSPMTSPTTPAVATVVKTSPTTPTVVTVVKKPQDPQLKEKVRNVEGKVKRRNSEGKAKKKKVANLAKKKVDVATTPAVKTTTTTATTASTSTIRAKEKPHMGDAQTQTDDLEIIAYIEREATSTPSIISHSRIKISRSCEASSEDELCDFISQRSRTPGAFSDISQHILSQTPSTVHHPAVGSPEAVYDEDGLFSFESPTIPTQQPIRPASTNLLSRSTSEECLPSEGEQSELECEELCALHSNTNTNEDRTSFDMSEPGPLSPQPGCSHWAIPNRPVSPPPPRLSALMPPPMSRPPRTPRKFFDERSDQSRLSFSSPEPPNMEEMEYDSSDTMQVGAEAADVHGTSDVGRLFNLLNQPGLMMEGIQMINRVSKKQMSTDEVERKLGIAADEPVKSKATGPASQTPVQRKRDISPDICDLVPDKRLRLVVAARRSRRDSSESTSRRNLSASGVAPDTDSNSAVVLRRPSTDEDSREHDPGGSDSFSSYRYGEAYEPRGDEFDLSQRSYCMLNVVPQYELKSRLYKMHSKAIRDTSIKQLIDHFKAIKADLLGIFKGEITSVRHIIYVSDGKGELRTLNVLVPFTSDQANILTTLIYDFIVPDKSMRYDYMDYVNFVLAPEAFIRIYSRINNLTYQMSETEMRYRACYEGNVSEENFRLASLD